MTRAILLRLFGLFVAAAIGVAATSLLAHGLQADAGFVGRLLRTLEDSFRQPLDEGRAVLAGSALLIVVIGAGTAMVRRAPRTVLRLTRTDAGTIHLDLSGLARVVQRRLRASVHPDITVSLKRKTLSITVPTTADETPLATVNDVAVATPEVLTSLGVDGVRHSVVTGPPASSRLQ